MLFRSFRIAITAREHAPWLTGPMTLAALALAAGIGVRASGLDHAGVSFCYFKALTGYACLTCGATRAIGHLSHLEFSQAFLVQPLLTLGTLAVMLWGLLDTLLLPAGKRTILRLEGRAPRAVFLFLAILAALNWAYLLATGV